MTKLPSIAKIKKFLYADWALRVKQRDGFKCLLCGATENLTAHHWYVCDHHAHAARYSVDNGATLCYACHIRGVHQRADYVSIRRLYFALRLVWSDENVGPASIEERLGAIENLSDTELTTAVYRNLWDAMRAREILLGARFVTRSVKKGGKCFLTVETVNPVAVVGNTIREIAGVGLCEVTAVAKTESGYRYTLKPLEENE